VSGIRRRDFVIMLGGGAAAWPLAARAEQAERMRRIGVLSGAAVDDQDNMVRLAAFRQQLQQLGWTDGHNVRIDYRFAAGSPENYRKYAAELVALAPDVILAPGGSLAPMLQATRTVPIVFAYSADPVGSGFVESLSRPGGNATGFVLFEYDLSAKWLELLKEIAPGVTRAAVPGPPRNHRDWPIRRHPVCGAVGRRGGEPTQHARRWRDRARRHGIRALE
jgi:putative ABC transport system substrate-binding protein